LKKIEKKEQSSKNFDIPINASTIMKGYISEGNINYYESRYDKALEFYQKAVEVDPNCAAAHHHMGLALRQLGKVEEAVISFRRALKIEPNHPLANNNMGLTLCQLGQDEEALIYYNKAL